MACFSSLTGEEARCKVKESRRKRIKNLFQRISILIPAPPEALQRALRADTYPFRQQEKTDTHPHQEDSQQGIGDACPSSSQASGQETGITGREKPFPIQAGSQQGDETRNGEDGLDNVVSGLWMYGEHGGQASVDMRMMRAPSSDSSTSTRTASPGNSSSTSSGHSMKQRAPL